MANCFKCKVRNTNFYLLCPDCGEDGTPMESCFQFEDESMKIIEEIEAKGE